MLRGLSRSLAGSRRACPLVLLLLPTPVRILVPARVDHTAVLLYRRRDRRDIHVVVPEEFAPRSAGGVVEPLEFTTRSVDALGPAIVSGFSCPREVPTRAWRQSQHQCSRSCSSCDAGGRLRFVENKAREEWEVVVGLLTRLWRASASTCGWCVSLCRIIACEVDNFNVINQSPNDTFHEAGATFWLTPTVHPAWSRLA
jgi:hypothetical protein